MIVQKFGGTSVADAAAIGRLIEMMSYELEIPLCCGGRGDACQTLSTERQRRPREDEPAASRAKYRP